MAKPESAPSYDPPYQEPPVEGGIPGLDYLRRLGTVYGAALERQIVESERVWQAFKSGSDIVGSLSRALIGGIESYYDVAISASRGPNRSEHPEWVYFSHDPLGSASDSASDSTDAAPRLRRDAPIDLPQPSGTSLAMSDFVSFQGSGEALKNLYRSCTLTASRKAVSIDLDVEEVDKYPPGQYMSFVTAKNRSGQTPLLIVVLSIISNSKEGGDAPSAAPPRTRSAPRLARAKVGKKKPTSRKKTRKA